MKKSVSSFLIAFALSFAAVSTAFAADTGNIMIERLSPWGSGTQVQVPTNVSCNGSTNQLVIPNGGPDTIHGRNFQLAMAALLASKPVNINWKCDPSGPIVVSVRLSN